MHLLNRTLYLNEKKGLVVTRDGPSIWVKEDGKAGWRIPARLIGHVIIMGNVRLDAGTITLFTDNNIPVTFLNKKGNEIALTIPYNHNLNSHYEEQKSILVHEERVEKYRQWLISERRKIQLKVVTKLSKKVGAIFRTNGFREMDYSDFIKRYVSVSEKRWSCVNSIISNYLNEMILRSILLANLDPHIGIYNRRYNFGMALDIFYAMEPEADMQTVQFFKIDKANDYLIHSSTGLRLTEEGLRNVVQRFENKKKLTQRLIDNVLDGLFEIMRYIRSLPETKIKIT